ncbi:protein phosphatase 2C domain-containing protein [Streptomyces sp. NPDC059171]|uniref:protein phosphatase 2C domain-containing protein n=1 Tax=Streptomyces sp. NPDC059171 TaxID=3346755 RepID=UPI0036CC318E
MSQQGEKPAAHEDDWWRKLYDESAPDTGPSRAADSLDDRFDSVSDAVSGPPDDHRAAAPETAPEPSEGPDPDAYEDPYTDPFADRYEAPDAEGLDAEGHEDPHGVGGPHGGGAPAPAVLAAAAEVPAPAPPSASTAAAGSAPTEAPAPTEAAPPRSAPPARSAPPPPSVPAPGAAPAQRSATAPLPAPPSVPPPVPAAPPVPSASPAPAPGLSPDPRVTPPPSPPRTDVFPAPWEAPGGQAGPRTFAAPRAPGAPESGGPPGAGPAADPGALHEPPPDPAAAGVRPAVGHLGDRPPTYDAEPAALPSATSENLDGLVPDTVLDGARYGTYTLRTASVRGDSARFRGEPRRDGLLTARFGAAESALVLVAVAGGRRDGEAAHLAAADACRWIGGAVARSHLRLSEDIRAGRRDDLKSGLHRLIDRTYGKLRARAAELDVEPDAYTANLRCLLLPADPECRTRVFFGVGSGGLFRLRDGLWQDLEPVAPQDPAVRPGDEPEAGPDGDRLTMDLQITGPVSPDAEGPPQPPGRPFGFRASVARPGDTLMLCSNGLAEPMRGEPALPGELAKRWGTEGPPGLPAFLADTQLRIKGYADDRTCAAVWEA